MTPTEAIDSAALYFWPHQLAASALWALIFFGAGVLLGALVWGMVPGRTRRLMAKNARLREEYESRAGGSPSPPV